MDELINELATLKNKIQGKCQCDEGGATIAAAKLLSYCAIKDFARHSNRLMSQILGHTEITDEEFEAIHGSSDIGGKGSSQTPPFAPANTPQEPENSGDEGAASNSEVRLEPEDLNSLMNTALGVARKATDVVIPEDHVRSVVEQVVHVNYPNLAQDQVTYIREEVLKAYRAGTGC